MDKYMDEKHSERQLEFELNQLGFSYWAGEAFRERLSDPNRRDAFTIQDERWFGQDKMALTAFIGDGKNSLLRLKSYDVSLRKEIVVPELEIEGINTGTLNRKMGSIDWSEDMDRPEVREAARADSSLQKLVDLSDEINQELKHLNESSLPQAWEVAHILALRHWLDTPYESRIPGAEEFKNVYEIRRTFSCDEMILPTVNQAKNLLEGTVIGRSILSPVDGIPVVEWFRLNMHEKDLAGNFVMEDLGFFDLALEMKSLPIRERYNNVAMHDIYQSLLEGNRPAVYYLEGDTETPVHLHVNAISQCIDLCDKQGQLIVTTADLAKEAITLDNGHHSITTNNNIMRNSNYNEANYEYIVGRLRQHHFPDTQNAELKEQMQQGKSRILLEFHSAEYAGAVKATVHVEKADSGTYFPNRYHLELQRPDSEYARRQYFPIQNFKGHGNQYDIPWKMGVNLLRGGQVLNTWLREDGSSIYEWRGLDFSQRSNAGYGYVSFDRQVLDVEKHLDQLPVQEKDRNDLRHSHVVRSIEMGNSQAVHLEVEGNPTIRLRANVRKGDLDIIRGGHVISIQQFNTELTEWREQGVYLGEAPSQQTQPGSRQPVGGQENSTARPVADGDPKVITSGLPARPERTTNPALVQNRTQATVNGNRVTNNNVDKTKRVLTGNRITPQAPNRSGNHIKHGR